MCLVLEVHELRQTSSIFYKLRLGIAYCMSLTPGPMTSSRLTRLHIFIRDVNETLGSETETRSRRLVFCPRRDPPRFFETATFDFWARDETETL